MTEEKDTAIKLNAIALALSFSGSQSLQTRVSEGKAGDSAAPKKTRNSIME